MRRVPLVLLGAGGVARSLVREILRLRSFHGARLALRFDLCGLCDSSALLADEAGLDDQLLLEAVEAKAQGHSLVSGAGERGALPRLVEGVASRGGILVDCSASDATTGLLRLALEAGGGVVLANKKPLCGSLEDYRVLSGAACRWAATVGSGLPMIMTVARLVAAGGEIERMTGSLSSTVGQIMTGLEGGLTFSRAVERTRLEGFSESDPRQDLLGLDLARKALILARAAGWEITMEEIEMRSLLPRGMEDLTLQAFLEKLPSLDPDWESRSRLALAEGKVLRFVATLESGSLRVGLEKVAKASPLGRLEGPDNLLQIQSRVYQPTPLVIQGRGAGPRATAAALLADILDLATGVLTN